MSTANFDSADPKWQCCCGCHVTTGTYVICMLSSVYLSIILFASIYFAIFTNLVWIFPLALMGFVFALGPIIGIKKTIPWLFIPFLIMHAGEIGYKLFRSGEALLLFDAENRRLAFISLLIFCILQTGVSIWLFTIVLRAFRYVWEWKKFKETRDVLPTQAEASAPIEVEVEPKMDDRPPPYAW